MSASPEASISPTSSPQLTPPPSAQPRQVSPELDDAARAQLELEEMMRSSPPPDESDSPASANSLHSDDIHTSSAQPPRISRTSSMANTSRNEIVFARRLAIKNKLHPYQRDEIEVFVKDTLVIRQVKLMIETYVVKNKLDTIIAATPSFAVSDALMESINSYVLAVLLSAKLSAYKGMTPRDHVLMILTENKVNIPANIDQDPHAVNKIKVAVQNALTQTRARIKKELKNSKIDDAALSIYDLATKIVTSTRCLVTVPLCARLALLRKVHTENDGPKFWNMVDLRLALIRTRAFSLVIRKIDPKKVSRAFAGILEQDRLLYGTLRAETLANSNSDVWQQSVDLVIDGNNLLAEETAVATAAGASVGGGGGEIDDDDVE